MCSIDDNMKRDKLIQWHEHLAIDGLLLTKAPLPKI